MSLVIVESPAKAKTINKYLGKDYKVLASYGHIRDLPSKNGSVDPEQGFAMVWETDTKSKKHLKEIADALEKTDKLILATDPDREGEAISWHLVEALRARRSLKKDTHVERVVFNAITKSAITEAIKNPRPVDMELVEAYLARRALDYLVGFNLSPVLWRKLPGSRSAGRVQSVALRLVVEREMEIDAFQSREYWSVKADLTTPRSDAFQARLIVLNGKKLDKFDLNNQEMAENAVQAIKSTTFQVASVEAKPTSRNPSAPFMTSTLQQEASRKLGFGAGHTMRVAQKLYEEGHITYMRTDGIDMAPEALQAARETIQKEYGQSYLPSSPRMYKTKAKNAQEAHECIRPTNFDVSKISSSDSDAVRLYDLIWKRALSSQMESARMERTTVDIKSPDDSIHLRATGQVIKFDGFLKLYQEGRDDEEDEDSGRLPVIHQGDALTTKQVIPEQHFTQPPPRFTEATLVKRMEELGIGRPSTYASIISVIQDRGYVKIDKKRLIPEDKGRLVTHFLETYFARYVQYDFTAEMEEKLDDISGGRIHWKDVLETFWKDFSAAIGETKDLRISEVLDCLNEIMGPHIFPPREDGKDARLCPGCDEGQLSLKTSKFGAFVGCSRYPDCKYTRKLDSNGTEDGSELTADGKLLGYQPESGLSVTLRTGRFGPYVQLGEQEEGSKEKPKRASLPKGLGVDDVDLKKALELLALPREVGKHPETGEPIFANLGRYGPYVQHEKTYASLDAPEEVFTVGLNRAVTLISDKLANPKAGRGQAAKPLKELGEHPEKKGAVNIMSGRYGPYVKWGKINATLPKDLKPEDVTMEQAVKILNEKLKK
jgi:DNA topoisomerase-1